VYVDQITDADMAGSSTGTVGVEEGDDVGGTSDVVVATDASSKPHPAVYSAQHQDHAARLTARRERLVHAEVASVYTMSTLNLLTGETKQSSVDGRNQKPSRDGRRYVACDLKL